jgi:Zn-dependent protease/CBS domain-containing protein
MRNAIRIGRLFGIELRVDTSWLLIFTLVIWSLTSLFGGWHPDWSIATRVIVAVIAALAFFASVLFHEMAHSLVARAYSIPVRDITLHMFGGVSNIEREPPTPRSEFFMAVVGPIASIVLGIALVLGGAAVSRIGANDATTAANLAREMGPVTTIIMWLGPVNIVVGLFNLIPGFPLDGGRILRSILWKATGSLRTATKWSTMIGQLTGWAFIVMGAFMALGYTVPFFGRGLSGGIWLALIGFFLRNAAVQHQAGHALAEELTGVRVNDLMRTRGPWVDAATPATVLPTMLIQNEQRALPVFEGSRFAGLVSVADLRREARSPNPYASARDVMTPLERLTVTTPDTDIVDALRALGRANASDLAVVLNGTLVGMLFERDIARWLELRAESGRPLRPTRHSHA